MTACEEGTYNPNKRSTNKSDCFTCPAGSFCKGQGLSWPSGPCDEGFFCPENSTEPKPPIGRCEANYFCPSGSPFQRPCADGQESEAQKGECSRCKSSFWCHNATKETCPAGHYCPQGTLLPVPCKPGRYRPETGGAKEADCHLCPPGKFCQGFGEILSFFFNYSRR